jgi:hypothetical protein
MKLQGVTTIIARFVTLVIGVAAAAVYLTTGAASLAAEDGRHRPFHLEKDCIAYTGAAGDHCTVTRSNLPEIPPGSIIYYDQANGIPAIPPNGFLDSNIFLYVATGDWAVGRCTLDNTTNLGVCTLSDGTGPLAGVTARVDVSFLGGTDGALYAWEGTYSFNPLPGR